MKMSHREFYLNCINRAERIIRISFNTDNNNDVFYRVISCEEGVDIQGTIEHKDKYAALRAVSCRKLEIAVFSFLMGHRYSSTDKVWKICEGAVEIYKNEIDKLGYFGVSDWWEEAKRLYRNQLLNKDNWDDDVNNVYLLD